MSLEEKKLLTDILTCIRDIDIHLGGKRDFNEYLQNKTMRRAVERELEIIGEAVGKLLKVNPSIPISYARLVVDLRNKVIHAYDSINNTIIWKIVNIDVPVLDKEVSELLQTAP
ncbi:MAG: DUF86 domain-containing protein [Bacteroidetes bacterium]|nr:DUF86 domain-containing protein [Bacteroidota bacterium]